MVVDKGGTNAVVTDAAGTELTGPVDVSDGPATVFVTLPDGGNPVTTATPTDTLDADGTLTGSVTAEVPVVASATTAVETFEARDQNIWGEGQAFILIWSEYAR